MYQQFRSTDDSDVRKAGRIANLLNRIATARTTLLDDEGRVRVVVFEFDGQWVGTLTYRSDGTCESAVTGPRFDRLTTGKTPDASRQFAVA